MATRQKSALRLVAELRALSLSHLRYGLEKSYLEKGVLIGINRRLLAMLFE